jgi:hypothetical protein
MLPFHETLERCAFSLSFLRSKPVLTAVTSQSSRRISPTSSPAFPSKPGNPPTCTPKSRPPRRFSTALHRPSRVVLERKAPSSSPPPTPSPPSPPQQAQPPSPSSPRTVTVEGRASQAMPSTTNPSSLVLLEQRNYTQAASRPRTGLVDLRVFIVV